MGPTFVTRAQEDTGAEPAQIARAYTAAREIFAMREVWERIEALDNKVTANLQYEAAFQTSRLLRHATYWLLASRTRLQVDAAVAEFRDDVRHLEAEIHEVLTGAELARFEESRKRFAEGGLPPALAVRIASLEALNAALDIAEIAAAHRVSVAETARVYFEVGTRIGFDWLRARIEKLTVDGPWQAIARSGLRDAALRVQRRLTERVLARKDRGSAQARVERLGGGRGQGPRALAAHTRRHARRRRGRLRHAHRGRGVGAQACQLKRAPHDTPRTCRPAGQADPGTPRPEHLERREPVHRLDGRGPIGARTARGGAGGARAAARGARRSTSPSPRCSSAPSAPCG